MFSIKKNCPRCKCGACYPLHRKGIDWPISLLGLRPARCLTCMRKFYTRYSIETQPMRSATSPVPVERNIRREGDSGNRWAA